MKGDVKMLELNIKANKLNMLWGCLRPTLIAIFSVHSVFIASPKFSMPLPEFESLNPESKRPKLDPPVRRLADGFVLEICAGQLGLRRVFFNMPVLQRRWLGGSYCAT